MAMLTPYRVVAKNALMSWNGLSDEEAQKIVETQSFDELEGQVWAKGSMLYAVSAIAQNLGLETVQTDLENIVLNGGGKQHSLTLSESGQQTLSEIGELLKANKNFSVVDVLSKVHDGWVKDNAKKFNKEGREGKKYQHLPIELIGWKEAKADLLFVEPILNSMGISIDEKQLEQEYNSRVETYFNKNGLVDEKGIDKAALTSFILKGAKYPPLTEQNTAKSKDEAQLMTTQVCEKLSNINLKSKNA